jgi:hypothetical protein
VRTMKSDILAYVAERRAEGRAVTWIANALHTAPLIVQDMLEGKWIPQYYTCTRKMWIRTQPIHGVIKPADFIPIDQIPVDNHAPMQDAILAIDEDCYIRLAYWHDEEGRWISECGIRTPLVLGLEIRRPRENGYDVEYLYGQTDNAQ